MQIPVCDPTGRPQKVLLIGFQDQDNLGLRYLMSTVNASGHEASIMTYRSDPDQILKRIHQDEPDVVGFSLIFQYMAPEVLGDQDASVRSDIYSVGVLLYRLVTGSYPVEGRSVQEVRDKHARGERTLRGV